MGWSVGREDVGYVIGVRYEVEMGVVWRGV